MARCSSSSGDVLRGDAIAPTVPHRGYPQNSLVSLWITCEQATLNKELYSPFNFA